MRSVVKHGLRLGAAAFVLTVLASGVSAEDVDTLFDVTPGQALTLDFNGVGGRLDVEGWDQDRVRIEGRIRGRGRRDEGLLEFDQSRHGIEVYAGSGYRDDDIDASLAIKVPQKFDLRIKAATETSITNVNGELELWIGNADVELKNVHGTCRIGTANGRLNIDGCTLDGDISNTNGRLTIDDSDVSGDVVSTNANMDLSRAPQGIEATSTNGNIRVESVMDHFRGKTTNGNVTIRQLDGWIDTETVNGNVRVRMVGDPEGKREVDIETLNGTVDVEIPADFSMNFDIEVRNEDRDRRERYEIISDFDLEIESDESRRGRYRVYGTGKLGSGSNRVRIRATNGDVYLRKARGSG